MGCYGREGIAVLRQGDKANVGYNGAPPQPLSGRHVQFTRCHRVNRRAAYNIPQPPASLPQRSAVSFGLPIPPPLATTRMVTRLYMPLARWKTPRRPTSPASNSSGLVYLFELFDGSHQPDLFRRRRTECGSCMAVLFVRAELVLHAVKSSYNARHSDGRARAMGIGCTNQYCLQRNGCICSSDASNYRSQRERGRMVVASNLGADNP